MTATKQIQNLADKTFATLCSAIITGEIKAGSKISEPELSAQLHVSRASLREAIGRLEACKLVTRKANIGARVISLSQQSLLEIYQIREALEGMAARQAAENASHKEITQLHQLLEHHNKETQKINGARYFQHTGDLDFHYHVVQCSHNQHLINLLGKDLYHLMRMYRYQFGSVSQRVAPALEEHSYVIHAIQAGDGELAELLMRNHIRRSRDNIMTLISEPLS